MSAAVPPSAQTFCLKDLTREQLLIVLDNFPVGKRMIVWAIWQDMTNRAAALTQKAVDANTQLNDFDGTREWKQKWDANNRMFDRGMALHEKADDFYEQHVKDRWDE